jgi:hypothetical protein
MPDDYPGLLARLAERKVAFVIVGGVALVLRGSGRGTFDIDICYDRRRDNLRRLSAALAPLKPTLRGAPSDLPFRLDPETLASGLNFTLDTTAGPLDLLGEIAGLGTYDIVERLSSELTLYGRPVKVLTLEGLERAKRAAGRQKDLADLAEILELRRQSGE